MPDEHVELFNIVRFTLSALLSGIAYFNYLCFNIKNLRNLLLRSLVYTRSLPVSTLNIRTTN